MLLSDIYPAKKLVDTYFKSVLGDLQSKQKHERKDTMEKQISPTPYQDELEKDVVQLILKLQQQATTSNTSKKGQ